MNNWKTASIILGIIALILIGQSLFIKEEMVYFGSFKIEQTNLNNLFKDVDIGKEMHLCNLETKECIFLKKLQT